MNTDVSVAPQASPKTLVLVPLCLHRAYKCTSYILGTILLCIIVLIITLALVFSNKKFMFTKSLKQALSVASVNDDSCKLNGVNCDLTIDSTVGPPNSFSPPDFVVRHEEGNPQEIKISSGSDVVSGIMFRSNDEKDPIVLPFSVSAAKFAAQLVSISEKAAANHVKPESNREDISVLATLSGKSANKNVNLGWVLKVEEPQNVGEETQRDQLWVVFRGTQTKPEWRQDFQMSQVKFSAETETLVHQGFYAAYVEIQKELISTITTFYAEAAAQKRSTTLYITGHSLGAAVALLAVADLVKSLRPLITDVRCYAFAAPRVGNNMFVNTVMDLSKSVLKEFAVFANSDDIVPSVPLAVQPNLDNPDTPWLYAQFPMNSFAANWGSWTHNHTLPVHIAYLNKL